MDDQLQNRFNGAFEYLEVGGESYGLLIDAIGEVLRLPTTAAKKSRSTSIPAWAKLAGGVHRPDGQLMVVLDVDLVLEIMPDIWAA